MSMNQTVATACFISYSHADNDAFNGVVDRLKSELAGRFHAVTGRQLDIFVDRDSIGWGADWRTRIRESVEAATFFIPIVTMRYFQSEGCREELMAFYENARQLGVTELILPIILAGGDQITADSPIEAVRIIEGLQYKDLEAAWLSGYESPLWLQTVGAMIEGMKAAIPTAESAIVQRQIVGDKTAEGAVAEATVQADVFAFNDELEEVTQKTQDVLAAMTHFGEVVKESMSGAALSTMPMRDRQAKLIRVAHEMKNPAEIFARKAADFEQKVTSTDAQLRAIVGELREIDNEQADGMLDNLLSSLKGMNQITDTVGQFDQILPTLRMAAMTNVSLRKAVEPAISAVQSMKSGLNTAQSWTLL